jgi:8-oxo-dGTP pyrophosphatase MutT (NUDIX family)
MNYINYIRNKVGHDCIFLNCVACAIFNTNGEVLLQRRSDRNSWGFPGGIMELGESFEEAARREVMEETGLEISVGKLLGVYSAYSDEYPNGDKAQPIVLLFEGHVTSGKLCCDDEETLELVYFSLKSPPALVNQQHRDMFLDLSSSKGEVIIR